MLSSTRSSARMSEARRSRSVGGFARTGLVLAWVMFWLNTALFPCCEVTAAVLSAHADSGSPTTSVAPPPHHSDATPSEPLNHGPDSPCGSTLSSGPPLVGEHQALTPERFPQEWFAVDTPVAASLTAVNHSANLALARAVPPPSLRLYLRTQRLLI